MILSSLSAVQKSNTNSTNSTNSFLEIIGFVYTYPYGESVSPYSPVITILMLGLWAYTPLPNCLLFLNQCLTYILVLPTSKDVGTLHVSMSLSGVCFEASI